MDNSTNDACTTALAASPYTVRLGTRVHLAREAAHVTHEALADDVGVTPAHLSHIGSGAVDPSIDEIRCMSRRLNCGADYLLATRPGTDECYAAIAI